MKHVANIFVLAALLFGPSSVLAHRSRHHAQHHNFPLTVVDDLGHHVHIARRPKRILSLDPRDTETLFALGAEKRLVGDGGAADEGDAYYHRPFRYPSEWPSPWGRDYPVRALKLAHIEGGSGGTQFNLETIEGLHPDLIFTLNDPSQAATYGKMRSLGLPLIVLDPSTCGGILHDITLAGRATGEVAHAKVVTANMRSQLDVVRRAIRKTRARPRVFYEIDASNPSKPYTAGKGTFVDQAIKLAGAHNIAAGSGLCSGKTCYPQINLEMLVSDNPQIILLGDAAYGSTVKSVEQRPGWSTISAVRKGKIYPFDDSLISRAGPRIAIGVRTMAGFIHPGLFRSK
ncbi:MAG: ABC transporter substrate-binding protein [Chloroflexota bacterium]